VLFIKNIYYVPLRSREGKTVGEYPLKKRLLPLFFDGIIVFLVDRKENETSVMKK